MIYYVPADGEFFFLLFLFWLKETQQAEINHRLNQSFLFFFPDPHPRHDYII